MKQFGKFLLSACLGCACLLLAGCQVLTMPLMMVYAVVVAAVQVVVNLVPYAVNMLPLLLLVINVPSDTQPTEYALAPLDIRAVYASNKFDEDTVLLDGLSFMRTLPVQQTDKPHRKILMAFEYGTPPRQIAQAVTAELHGCQPVSVTAHLIDGASLFNDKFAFFSVLEKLKSNGIMLKCFGILESTTNLFNESGDK